MQHDVEAADAGERGFEAADQQVVLGRDGAVDAAVARHAVFAHVQALRGERA